MDNKLKKNQLKEDEKWMRIALQEAEKAYENGEIPVGVVLVYENKKLFKCHNQVELLHDVTAHAELMSISSAGEYLQSKYLQDVTMYVTLEPCAMCAAAIGWAQISRLVFGASDEQKGFRTTAPEVLHPKCMTRSGLFANESKELLKNFFADKRQ